MSYQSDILAIRAHSNPGPVVSAPSPEIQIPVEPLIDGKEAAKRIGCSTRQLLNLRKQGFVPHAPGFARRFRASDVARYLKGETK